MTYRGGQRNGGLCIAARWRLLAAAVVALASSAAPAAESATPPLSEAAFFNDLPIVLTVTRLAQPKSETPAAVTVIDREMIRASGVRRLPDLFWLVPGFQVGFDHATGATVTYHGLSDEFARRMQVLVDGRSVYDPATGGVFWNALPLAIDDIERIEVIRGPNAAAYGSNAFLGVINITTRHASRDLGPFGAVNIGEHEIRDGTARYGWFSPNGYSRLTAAYLHDDGFDGLIDSSTSRIASFRGDYRLRTGDDVELQLGANAESHGSGEVGKPTDLPRGADALSHFQLLRWRRAYAPSDELSVQLYHNYLSNKEGFVTPPIDLGPFGIVTVPVNFDARTERYDVELQRVMSPSTTERYVWGAGGRFDKAHSNTFFGPDPIENRVYRVFGNAEWRWRDATIVNAGAMWEEDGISGSRLLPRVALNHHLSPRHTLRAAASRAARTPAFIEEHGDVSFSSGGVLLDQTITASGGLKAETMTSYELGYLGEWPERHLTIDTRLYHDRMDDLITELVVPAPDIDGTTFDARNEGRADVVGAEIQIDYRYSEATRLLFNYARMHADVSGLSPQAHFDAGRQERSVPRYVTSLLAIHRFTDRWQGSLVYHRVGAMQWLGVGDPLVAFGRVDVRLARQLRLGRANGEMAVTVQNVGHAAPTFGSEDVFDRRAFLTLTLYE